MDIGTMELRYLDFEYSEDAEGQGLFDAMASVMGEHLSPAHAEVSAVLGWAHAHFPHVCGPLDEGMEWDYDLAEVQESPAGRVNFFEAKSGGPGLFADQVNQAGAAGHVGEANEAASIRHTVSLSINGTPTFCAAFRAQFGLEAL